MSVATQIERIQTDRDTIRAKAVNLGIAQDNANLDELATAISGIANNGAVSAEVKEGETYTIPKGYHNGSGTVSGVAGGGNYKLQSKTIQPTKQQQNITPDSGYYGLSDVTIEAIPVSYQDVSSVTATAPDVLTGKTIVSSTGVVTAGTMKNNGAVSKKLDTTTTSYTIPVGYHNGSGSVSIDTEETSATPTTSVQEIGPTAGKVLSKVTIGAIPAQFANTSDATVVAENLLDGVIAYGCVEEGDEEKVKRAVEVEGTMPNNGSVKQTLNTTTTSYTIPKGYHDGTGAVSITTETKTATPTKSSQSITPTTGKVLSSVTVAAIPDVYQDVSAVTVTADKMLVGSVAVGADGSTIKGSMANNGAMNKEIDGLTTSSVAIPAGYTTGGTVSLTSDIEDALAAI